VAVTVHTQISGVLLKGFHETLGRNSRNRVQGNPYSSQTYNQYWCWLATVVVCVCEQYAVSDDQ